MKDDVNQYYGFIILIFLVVKIILFLVLWSWLRIRVTERMIDLTNKLKTNEQSDKRSYKPRLSMMDGSTNPNYQKRGSIDSKKIL